MTTARDVAIDVLVRVEGGAYSNALLPVALRRSGLAARDRAFATDLVYSSLREQRLLDHLLAPYLRRPLARLEPAVRAGLRIGAHQIVAGVPAHAAVGETVAAVGRVTPRARGLVNAVLRKLAASGPPWAVPDGDDVASVAVRTSHPDWIVERLVADLGAADALAVLDSDGHAPEVTLRANPWRTDPDALATELRAAGARVEPSALATGASTVRGIGDPAALAAVAEGRATPQDAASQAVVAALDPRPGEHVLDVAAAPGGKASAIAERVGPEGVVVALDHHAGRVGRIVAVAQRLGLPWLAPAVADGRALPVAGAAFDRVLVDAPCSGLGVLRRRPEARWRVEPTAPATLAALQRELLASAAATLRPGGTLVYSVCTLTAEETIGVDEWAATALGDLEALPPPGAPWRPHGRGALLLPSDAGTDGMFVLRLRARPTLPLG